jgi:hypothetical protein
MESLPNRKPIWKRPRWIALAVALYVLGVYVAMVLTIPARAGAYLDQGAEPVKVMEKLDFIQIRDRRGYAGSMGRQGAFDAGEEAIMQENALFREVAFFGARTLMPASLKDCLNAHYEMRYDFFDRARRFSKLTLVEMAEVSRMFQDIGAIEKTRAQCRDLLLRIKTRSAPPPVAEADLPQFAPPAAMQTSRFVAPSGVPYVAPTLVVEPIASQVAAPAADPLLRFPETSGGFDETDDCLGGLKRYVIRDSGNWTDANRAAVLRNCSTNREKFMCFIERSGTDFVSNAEKNQIEIACDLNDN